METIAVMRTLLDLVPGRLKQMSREQAESKPAPAQWSAKEELGHLLDSAANNHQRIVRVQLEDKLAMPGYDQTKWVRIHSYQARDWNELVGLWTALNHQLVTAAETVPQSAWSHTLTIGNGQPVTLEFVFEDYVAHMVHHLEHIGIEVSDIQSRKWSAA